LRLVSDKSKKVLWIYFGLVFAELLCVSAFYIELRRALGGNTLSWAYVVEWPIFAVYALYMWHRLLKEERPSERAAAPATLEGDDPKLVAYNNYLSAVHAPRDEATDPTDD